MNAEKAMNWTANYSKWSAEESVQTKKREEDNTPFTKPPTHNLMQMERTPKHMQLSMAIKNVIKKSGATLNHNTSLQETNSLSLYVPSPLSTISLPVVMHKNSGIFAINFIMVVKVLPFTFF